MLRNCILCLALCSTMACDDEPAETAKVASAATTPTTKPAAPTEAEPTPAIAATAEPAAVAAAGAAEPDAPAKGAAPVVLATFPALPSDAVLLPLELVGARMRAPKGAKAGRSINGWQEVTAPGFAMVVRESYDDIAAAKASIAPTKLAVDEPGTIVYEAKRGFGFAQIVDAKGPPEQDGEADRRYECRAGEAMDWARGQPDELYPRAQVDLMVTYCRSLQPAG
ncbi:MAG: hypothetical protein IPH07_36005 [Deltaproteobacteria bacterium]|nr:hypothetical protein [Deltaproteobacteria bacterium]MBK8235591.1 hypothetical protein [Deltaproteobacteria bacterium]MBP7288901.1 hypothetical protein [Nannocystaceae bacterium]